MAGTGKTYRLYVVDTSIGPNLRAAVHKAIDNSAPKGSLLLPATSFQNLTQKLGQLSKQEEIAIRGRISDVTIIAHGGEAGSFHMGRDLVGHTDFDRVKKPFAALAEGAHIDIIRCTALGSQPASTPEDRRSLYKKIGQALLPGGGRVSGTADDVWFSDGGGVLLTHPKGGQHVPVGGRYPTQYHSLEVLKRVPQEAEEQVFHRVRGGDRVWYLAQDYGYRNPEDFVREVETLNPGINFKRLQPGQAIKVPTRVGVPAVLSEPYALRQREAMRTTFTPIPSTLQRLREALERTPGPPPAAAIRGLGTMSVLQRMQREAAERERTQAWLKNVQQQLNRRPPATGAFRSQIGQVADQFKPHGMSTGLGGSGAFRSQISLLNDQLKRTPDVWRAPTFDTTKTLERIEQDARDRQRTQDWLHRVDNQLNRRPAGGFRSQIGLLNEQLMRTPDAWRAPTFDTMKTLERIEQEARDRQRTQSWLSGLAKQFK